MREIKFRAQRRNKEEYEDLWDYFSIEINDGELWLGDLNLATLGQYTGLHDRNGKEIYEGDIVKCSDCVRDVGVVEYFVDGWKEQRVIGCFTVRCHIVDGMAESDMGGDRELIYTNKKWDSYGVAGLEVIGNIYENGELLNEKD